MEAGFSFSPQGSGGPCLWNDFVLPASTQDRPAAADIAFCIAAFANGMTEDRIERALEDDYLAPDSSPSQRAAYIRRTMERREIGLCDRFRA